MSSFTDWNGPQGSVKASDLVQLANAYSELVTKLNQHMESTPSPNDVHGVRTYVEAQLATIRDLIPNVSAFITESAADAKYALQSQIPTDVVHSADIANFITMTAVNTALASYLRTNDLASQQVILDIQADIDAIEQALNTIPFSMPILKATDYIEGLIHAIEQVKFIDKDIPTVVGGSDPNGKYWLLGMQTEDKQAGTAYIKYTNTNPFTAIVNFTASKVNGKYTGALSVLTDTVIEGLKFKLVYGTDRDSEEHVYLAIQAPEWLALDSLQLSVSGINFRVLGSEGCIVPNGTCHDIVDCYAKAGLSASKINVPMGNVGEVVGWCKFDADGVPIDFPDNCHVCDGSPVDPTKWPELIAKGITTFPLVDYNIIIAGTSVSDPGSEQYTIKTIVNGTGTVELNKSSVETNETVVVTLSDAPTAMHILNNTTGQLIVATQVDTTNVYTFTMPASDVTIIVDFA